MDNKPPTTDSAQAELVTMLSPLAPVPDPPEGKRDAGLTTRLGTLSRIVGGDDLAKRIIAENSPTLDIRRGAARRLGRRMRGFL